MVIAIIFLIHIIFAGFVFLRRLKLESIGNAFIDLIFIIIIFSVGWSLSTMICNIFFDPIGFGKHFDRDTISLSLLTIAEYFF